MRLIAVPSSPITVVPAWRPAAAALLLILSACGGGGGGGGNGSGEVAVDTTAGAAPVDTDAVALSAALSGGEARGVSLPVVMAAAQARLVAQQAAHAASRRALFGLAADGSLLPGSVDAIDWDPSHDSVTFNVLDSGRNQVMLAGNWRYSDGRAGSGQALAVLGQAPVTNARYAAFGGNPLGVPGNAAMDRLMKNTLAWLSPRSGAADFKVVTAHLPGQATYWFPHEPRVRAWFAAQYPGVTLNGQPAAQATQDDRCDGDRLDACLQGADLLVLGREQAPTGLNSQSPDDYPAAYDGSTVMQAVRAAQARGIPVLYLHHYRDANDLAARLLDYFGLSVTNNYWAQEGLKAYGPASVAATPATADATLALLRRLDQGGFGTTWSGCVDDLGRMQCERSGGFAGDAALSDEFAEPAKALRSRLRALDAQGLDLFAQPGYEQEKLLVLLGDKYREAVSYPMTKEAAGADFFRAYFSDLVVYHRRSHAAVARNLGNFSNLFPADLPTLSRTVATTAPASGRREHLTGLYVLPGRSVTLTRRDASAASVTVGVNLLRDSTHVYNTYDRPSGLASPRLPLAAGGSLTLTSPFGGPLFLFVEAAAGAPLVEVQVDGVITHPVLRDPADPAQVAAFQAELASTPTNWVGLATDFLTLHSTLGHFRRSLADQGGDLAKLVSRIDTYLVKDTYELAGFNAATPGTFTLAPEVAAFCAAAGWDCSGLQHRRDVMQHVIADEYSTCGSACSGNPYDQSFALDPLGWGETHEIGHNLQVARLKIYGGQSGEVSNNIFPAHKQMRFNQATSPASPLVRGGSGTRAAFDLIKASLASADPVAQMRADVWADTRYAANNALRLGFYRQLVEYARHYNPSLGDGWALYTLMYLLDRNFGASAASWGSAAAGLGFGTYAAYPAAMDGNDFMLIAASRIIGRDMRPVFDLWGVTTSAAARAQVAAQGAPAAARLLFPMADVNRFGAGVGAPVTMTTTATYPTGF